MTVVRTVGVVGGGVVGHATARSFMETHEVRVYDLDPRKGTHDLSAVLACDVVFVCLPTPQKSDGLGCDLSAVTGFFSSCMVRPGSTPADTPFVLRSTVPVGTTRRLSREFNLTNMVHSPEFLTARCAVTDAMVPARMVVGTPDLDYGVASRRLRALYAARWPHVPVHWRLTSDESEAVKLYQNSFFAVKVAFWNEVRAHADAAGLNWDRVRAAILADGRIHPSHTQVPGPDGKFGFGPDHASACLPKDIANLIDCLESTAGCSAPVMRAALQRNAADRARGV